MYRNGIKRLLAVILSLGGMICLSPLLLVLCIAIKLDSPGPVFSKQKRVGIHKQHFNILKFRTMRIDTPRYALHLLHDPDQYHHPVGRFHIKASLDRAAPAVGIFLWATWRSSSPTVLWNQYDLLAAGQIPVPTMSPRPDRLGPDPWRDELEIADKARLDSYYVGT